MTIKQQGGIFGRNPTFNNVDVDGTLTVNQIVEKTSASGISLDGVVLKDGNVVLADGKGIDFSATSDASGSSSELFDDYEEGGFVPNVEGTTTAGAGTYSSRAGKYTKVGNRVMFNCWINMTAHTGSGNMVVTGLPYTSNSGNNFHSCNVDYSSALIVPSGQIPLGIILNGSSEILFYSRPTGTTSLTALALDTGFAMNISGQYEAA